MEVISCLCHSRGTLLSLFKSVYSVPPLKPVMSHTVSACLQGLGNIHSVSTHQLCVQTYSTSVVLWKKETFWSSKKESSSEDKTETLKMAEKQWQKSTNAKHCVTRETFKGDKEFWVWEIPGKSGLNLEQGIKMDFWKICLHVLNKSKL